MRSMRRALVYRRIDVERVRQESLFGRQEHAPDRWLRILVEEVGEVAHAIDEERYDAMEDEITQVAAVAVAWLEARATARAGARSMPGLRVNLEATPGCGGKHAVLPLQMRASVRHGGSDEHEAEA